MQAAGDAAGAAAALSGGLDKVNIALRLEKVSGSIKLIIHS